MVGRGGPPRQRQHVHDSIRPFRLTVALGLKIEEMVAATDFSLCLFVIQPEDETESETFLSIS